MKNSFTAFEYFYSTLGKVVTIKHAKIWKTLYSFQVHFLSSGWNHWNFCPFKQNKTKLKGKQGWPFNEWKDNYASKMPYISPISGQNHLLVKKDGLWWTNFIFRGPNLCYGFTYSSISLFIFFNSLENLLKFIKALFKNKSISIQVWS